MFNISVLGFGSIGQRHADNLRKLGCNISIFDPDTSKVELIEKKKYKLISIRKDAFKDVDAVVIASPNKYHFEDLKYAVLSGCNIFIEKPLSHSCKGVAEILSDADEKSLVIFSGYNLRYNPVYIKANEVIKNNQLGEILWGRFLFASYLPSWRPLQDHRTGYTADSISGGILLDLIHEFDIANYLLGEAETATASCRISKRLDIATEDYADVVLRHKNGVCSSIHLDYNTRPAMRSCDVAGEKGVISLDVNNRTYKFIDNSSVVQDEIKYSGSYDDDYYNQMKGFLDAIQGNNKNYCDGRESLSVLNQVITARKMCELPIS